MYIAHVCHPTETYGHSRRCIFYLYYLVIRAASRLLLTRPTAYPRPRHSTTWRYVSPFLLHSSHLLSRSPGEAPDVSRAVGVCFSQTQVTRGQRHEDTIWLKGKLAMRRRCSEKYSHSGSKSMEDGIQTPSKQSTGLQSRCKVVASSTKRRRCGERYVLAPTDVF